jgi:hypothetical protein
MKVFLLLLVVFVGYYFLTSWMIDSHYKEIAQQEQYVKTHGCTLVETIPVRSVGMMVHGETDIYKCSDGKTIVIN